MRVFPKFLYQITSSQEQEELKIKLDSLLKKDKYEGYWENNCLYINRIVPVRNMITPDIKVEIINNTSERIVSAEFEIRYRFEIIMRVLILLFSLIEFFIIRSFIINHLFKIEFILPIVSGFFGYFFIYISYWWDSDSFKYDLKKILK